MPLLFGNLLQQVLRSLSCVAQPGLHSSLPDPGTRTNSPHRMTLRVGNRHRCVLHLPGNWPTEPSHVDPLFPWTAPCIPRTWTWLPSNLHARKTTSPIP